MDQLLSLFLDGFNNSRMAVPHVIYCYACHAVYILFSIDVRHHRTACFSYGNGLARIGIENISLEFLDYIVIIQCHVHSRFYLAPAVSKMLISSFITVSVEWTRMPFS